MPRLLAIIFELALYAGALWLLFFLSTILHEAGHAIGYLLATGDTHWHIRVGWGKRLLDTQGLSVNLLPFDGFFTPLRREGIDSKAKLVMTLSGGPIASAVAVVGLLLVKCGGMSIHSEVIASSAVESLVDSALFVNLSILLLSAIPTHYFFGEIKGLESDGLQIAKALRGDQEKGRGTDKLEP
ncbi:MAG: hypothetical protein IJH08_05270 [Atopobiaceae bacterium]|nr:hypothetical protein [Atopobiaceae bacterium]